MFDDLSYYEAAEPLECQSQVSQDFLYDLVKLFICSFKTYFQTVAALFCHKCQVLFTSK